MKPSEVFGNTAGLPLISDKMLKIFQDKGFTGFKSQAVKIFGKANSEIKGFNLIQVTGRSGPLDDSNAQLAIRPNMIGTKMVKRKIGYEVADWDNSDFFCPGTSSLMLVPFH